MSDKDKKAASLFEQALTSLSSEVKDSVREYFSPLRSMVNEVKNAASPQRNDDLEERSDRPEKSARDRL